MSERNISVINRLSRFITNLYHICGGFLTLCHFQKILMKNSRVLSKSLM